MAFLREALARKGAMTAAELRAVPDRRVVKTCCIVTTRQQPETAKGTTFISLEDETGDVQVIVHRAIWERQLQVMLNAKLLGVKGVWQRDGDVMNLIAGFLVDLTPMLGRLRTGSRDFR